MLSKFTVITDLSFGLAREKFLKMNDSYNDIKLEINLYLVDEILSVLNQTVINTNYVFLIAPRPTFWKNSKQLIFIVLCGTQISSIDFISTSFSCSNHESSES